MTMTDVEVVARRVDERLLREGVVRRLLRRPELGALIAAILVWVSFAAVAGDKGFLSLRGTATYLEVAAELGILAVPVALLMIAGEFDLSVGSMIGAAGMMVPLLSIEAGIPVWGAILAAIAFALLIGFLNGLMVIKTGLPSFIVTLGGLFVIRGATIGITRLITGRTQLGFLDRADGFDVVRPIFGSEFGIGGADFAVSIIWWAGIAVLGTWVLRRTRFGNWTFASGGNPEAARNVGVPVSRVKITLFMATALGAALVAIIQAVLFNGSDVLRGRFREFEAIITVVIGGTLLSGGYGSVVGAVLGALIFGMVRQGIVITGVNADWFQVFLGGMLVVAVLVNNYIRTKAAESRR